MPGNLFVVSRLGQVRNAQTLIRQEGLVRNRLAIVHTAANPGLTRTVSDHVDPDLFEQVVQLTLPDRPLSQGPRKNRRIFALIEKLTVEMADTGVDALYLCNIDAFYSFFGRVIRERGLAVSVNLLEEGLNTYANLAAQGYERDTRADRSDVVASVRIAVSASARALRAGWVLLATLVSWVLHIDVVRVRTWATGTMGVPSRFRYGRVESFDTAWLCFPEKTHPERVSVNELRRLDFDATTVPNAAVTATIDDHATVFVSQKYLRPAEYLSIVLDVLSEVGPGPVYLKRHPREDRGEFDRLLKLLRVEHAGLEIRMIEPIQSVPVEQLVAAGKVNRLIGLTSTSLMYTAAYYPDVEVLSIAHRFVQVARSPRYGIAKRALSEFARDYRVFADVSGVRQFGER